jgi:hypothetical protein
MSFSVVEMMSMLNMTPAQNSGLSKNVRKHRNAKMKRSFAAGGAGGLAALMSSTEFTAYINPARSTKVVKGESKKGARVIASPPGIDSRSLSNGAGGWGRLPNVSPIDYADDDPRGWVHVDNSKRSRRCRIDEDVDAEHQP